MDEEQGRGGWWDLKYTSIAVFAPCKYSQYDANKIGNIDESNIISSMRRKIQIHEYSESTEIEEGK